MLVSVVICWYYLTYVDLFSIIFDFGNSNEGITPRFNRLLLGSIAEKKNNTHIHITSIRNQIPNQPPKKSFSLKCLLHTYISLVGLRIFSFLNHFPYKFLSLNGNLCKELVSPLLVLHPETQQCLLFVFFSWSDILMAVRFFEDNHINNIINLYIL